MLAALRLLVEVRENNSGAFRAQYDKTALCPIHYENYIFVVGLYTTLRCQLSTKDQQNTISYYNTWSAELIPVPHPSGLVFHPPPKS